MNSLPKRCAAEFVGTFFLVFIGTGAVVVDGQTGGALGHVGVSLAFGIVIMTMIYATGHISGAHFNPAVTIAFASIKRFPAAEIPAYVATQCMAALTGSIAVQLLVTGDYGAGETVPAASVGVASAIGIEVILTFALVFVIIAVATDERVPAAATGLSIGATVAMCSLMGGPLTGASMNPARSIGPAIAAGVWTLHWIYWVAPALGGLLAAFAYDQMRE